MQLTHEQEAMAAAVEDQWLATALETGPADRAAAEEGVRVSYRLAGLEPPTRIYWFGSPRAAAVAVALLTGVSVPSSSGVSPSSGVLSSSSGPGSADGETLPEWFGGVVAELRRQGWQTGETAGASVRRQVRTEPWAAARAAAAAELGAEGWAQLGSAAGRRSWGLAMDRVAGRLRLRLGEDLIAGLPADLGKAVRSRLLDAIYGQFDGAWLGTFDAAGRLSPQAGSESPQAGPGSLETESESLEAGSGSLETGSGLSQDGSGAGLAGLAAVARQAGWWWAHERVAVLSERPALLARDNVGRLHRGEGAAMEFTDGYGLWAWRGMPIPPELAAELPTLTLDRIQAEENAEIRRVMLEHFGYERYLQEAGARQLGSDETGTLWYLDLPGDEPLVMVEVVNSTPEPDGTSRVYWLRVPPDTRTARAGVAWTFGLTEEEYHPLVQT
ncbi:DUF6745 domain-containing protein [Actinoplanes rectilineatus]|uniref:DUF6745 domain-containing protein n=1 Tax=Actinoplanes rectilineatus TaxID=113571 RepID=UPI00069924BE|nr:hypothetical protein [Actinoplanes rectilineatus]